MSVLLRSMLVLSVTSLLMVGCGEKQEEVAVEAAPTAVAPVAAPVAEAPPAAEPGGYVPTAEERIPGITLDAAAVEAAAAVVAPAAEAAPKAE